MKYEGSLYAKVSGRYIRLDYNTKQFDEMYDTLKWFVNAIEDGSLIMFTGDDQHKAVRDENQEQIDKMYLLLKSLK